MGEDYGLSKVCSGQIVVDNVPGDHETCVSEYQKDIASLISARSCPSISKSEHVTSVDKKVSVHLGTWVRTTFIHGYESGNIPKARGERIIQKIGECSLIFVNGTKLKNKTWLDYIYSGGGFGGKMAVNSLLVSYNSRQKMGEGLRAAPGHDTLYIY